MQRAVLIAVAGAVMLSGGATVPARAADTAAASTLQFSGYSWQIKSATSPVGPGPNLFSASGPFVDTSGYLHLRIRQKTTGQWTASEVVGESTLGYGTYTWTVHGPVDSLDPNVVLGLFTYDATAGAPAANPEIDFEAARWGNSALGADNADYVVQPASPSTAQYFRLPPGSTLTVTYDWTPGQVVFSGHAVNSTGKVTALPAYTVTGSAVPASGSELVHMNLWLYQGQPPLNGKPVNLTIENFSFTPAS